VVKEVTAYLPARGSTGALPTRTTATSEATNKTVTVKLPKREVIQEVQLWQI